MAVRELKHGLIPARRELRMIEELTEEINAPTIKPSKLSPKIFRDSISMPGKVDYFVVWDDFKLLPQDVRTRIIYHALEEAKGPRETSRISIVMGLTRDEARQLEIET